MDNNDDDDFDSLLSTIGFGRWQIPTLAAVILGELSDLATENDVDDDDDSNDNDYDHNGEDNYDTFDSN